MAALPLVLVHGFMGGSAQWRSQQATLGQRIELITVDLPGFGAASGERAPDTIRGFAEHVLAELDARGVQRFHLLGHSMGGMIVQQMIALAPARIARLVLYGTGALGALPGRFESFDVSRQRLHDDGVQATAHRISATWFLQRERSARATECAELAARSSQQAMLASLDAMQRFDLRDALGDIGSPTLVLWGEADRTYTWPVIEQLWRTIPGASLAVVPAAAHAVHMEREALFDALVADFVAPD